MVEKVNGGEGRAEEEGRLRVLYIIGTVHKLGRADARNQKMVDGRIGGEPKEGERDTLTHMKLVAMQ